MYSLQDVDAQTDDILRRRALIAAALAQAATTLEAAEVGLGIAVLDGDEAAPAAVADLRLRCDGFNAALQELERRLAAAKVDRRRAEADALRRQAADKRRELADLEARAEEHLAALSALEDVQYSRCILAAQRGCEFQPVAGVANLGEAMSPAECSPVNLIQAYVLPRSRRLLNEAVGLERQADAIDVELAPAPPAPVLQPDGWQEIPAEPYYPWPTRPGLSGQA